MDHIALDGAGADDGDLNHQIVKGAGAHTRQEVHLRAALDLKNADTVGAAEHVVNICVLGWEGRQAVRLVVVQLEQIKAFADAGQHAKRQNIDLQNAKCVDIVFVPADDRAVLHRGVFDGHKFIQPPFGHDKAADMLAEVARKADDFKNQIHRQPQAMVVRVKADLAHAVFFETVG